MPERTSRDRAKAGSLVSADDRNGLVSRIGPVEIDWPRSIGYFGGIGLALGAELIDPPLAVFIAAIPFLKMLNRRRAARPSRFAGQVLEGLAKPLGGDSQGTIRLVSAEGSSDEPLV